MNINVSNLTVLAEGGEGIIYDYSDTTVIKTYKSYIDLKSKEKKVLSLLKKSNANLLPKEIISPIDIIYDLNGKFIGYEMKKISGEDFKKLSNKKFISSNKITIKDILNMLITIKSVIDTLHSLNIFIGDLNDQNILFDLNKNIYFIDCDSWTIDNEKCTVAMDLFKDPLLNQNNFNANTDIYAFSVLAFKTLTKIHPFGGTMNPDIDILDRMRQGISVIDNNDVKIPRTILSWKFMSPELINSFKNIFENTSRVFDNELNELYDNLKLCPDHKDYFYSKYNNCPICDLTAKLLIKPISQGVVKGLSLIPILKENESRIVLNENTYINQFGDIVNTEYNKSVHFDNGFIYHFTDESIIMDSYSNFKIIKDLSENIFEKRYKSNIITESNCVYYINNKGSLIKTTILKDGNSIEKIADCANNAWFDIKDDHFCIINLYNNYLIINIDGFNTKIDNIKSIINYGISYDNKDGNWLITLENSSGKFKTLVLNKNKILFNDDRINYKCQLSNLCIYGNTIFIPIENNIRGYAYTKDVFKDFECSVITNDSKLIKRGKSFIIVNDENIYNLG